MNDTHQCPCQMNSRVRHHHEWLVHNDSKQAPKGTKCPQGRPSTGWRGNHDMLTTLRSICPTCGGSSTARECGTAAKALYTCLILMGYSSCVSGDGARGCTRGRWGRRRRGGGVEKQTKDKRDGTANERQSSKGRAQEENAGLDRMQPAIAIVLMKGWRERREFDSMREVCGYGDDLGEYFGLHWYPEIMWV